MSVPITKRDGHILTDARAAEMGPRLVRETGLHDLSQQLIERGQAAGAIRADFSADDIGMIMCGLASTMHFGNPHSDWERHLTFLLDGLRPPRA